MMNKFLKYCSEGNSEGMRECLAYVDVDSTDKHGETGLHIVSLKGYAECTRILIASGASLDIKNLNGDTPLHIALSAGNENIALLLIQAGADLDSLNQLGDGPIHTAASKGYTNVVRALCEFGCVLDYPNDEGLYPVHLAAKNGHIDVIRYLCLYGCNVEQRNLKGIKAEIKAFKNGHYEVGELLNKLRIRNCRESYINQLVPSNKLLTKCNVKFLGCVATGKSTLIRSLKASYFESLLARTKAKNMHVFPGRYSKGSSTAMQIEMDFTSRRSSSNELQNHEYTEGIKIHEASFGTGEVNLWEFSGLETYYFIYDYFLGDSSSFFVIVFDSSLKAAKQYYQCSYWLTFLQSRIQSLDKPHIRVLLVGTHADLSSAQKNAQGIYSNDSVQEMRNRLTQEFPLFVFEKKLILCNAQLPNSYEIREIKNIIAENKVRILQDLVKSTKFLELTVQCLKTWRKEFELFPVISLEVFVDKIHRCVNPLAGSEYIAELITQLTVVGEVFYLRSKTSAKELIILDIDWLCNGVLGVLLSLDTISKARITGCFTEEDFQSCTPQGPADRMLDLLSILQICTQCENDGETEFEFPCYNFVEKLDGLWTATDKRYTSMGCYGGVRFKAPFNMLQTVFNRLQVQLRRDIVEYQDSDIDLYQWFQGSKLCLGDIESLISLEENGGAIEVKVRATNLLRMSCFYFMNEILNIIKKVLFLVAPGLICERHILSSQDLSNHSKTVHSWPPEHFFSGVLSGGVNAAFWNPHRNENESLLDLVGFGCEKVRDKIILGTDLPVSELSEHCFQALAQLLDPPDPLGKDWCLLAVKLELSHKIAAIDNGCSLSKTLALIDLWRKTKEATIGNFVKKLLGFGRDDAAKLVMRCAPLYKALPSRDIEKTPTLDYFPFSR